MALPVGGKDVEGVPTNLMLRRLRRRLRLFAAAWRRKSWWITKFNRFVLGRWNVLEVRRAGQIIKHCPFFGATIYVEKSVIRRHYVDWNQVLSYGEIVEVGGITVCDYFEETERGTVMVGPLVAQEANIVNGGETDAQRSDLARLREIVIAVAMEEPDAGKQAKEYALEFMMGAEG